MRLRSTAHLPGEAKKIDVFGRRVPRFLRAVDCSADIEAMSTLRATAAARVTTGIGVILTLAFAAALAALDLRLFSRVATNVPPGLPGLIVGLDLAAGGFLFIG